MTKCSFRFSASPLVFASLLAIAAGFAPARSEAATTPEIHFYPEYGWQLGNTSAGGAGCNIKSQFNNGFVMTFQGTHEWVQQLDIDFRQNIFKRGEVYPVALSVPGIAVKRFQARAIDEQNLALSLKGQKEFYAAIRDSSVIDMTIEQNDFRFYLTGFSKSAKGFEQCLAGLDSSTAKPMPAVDAVPPPPMPDAVSSEIAEIAKETMEPPPAAPAPTPVVAAPVVEAKAVAATPPPVKSIILPDPVPAPAPRETVAQLPDIPPEELVKPPSDFLLNESIAYEEAEVTGVPITEIIPEIPQAEIEGIPPQRMQNISGATANGEAGTGSIDGDIEVSRYTAAPVSEPLKRPEPRERLTERLQAQIEANPELAWAADPNDPRKSYVGTEREPLKLPPDLQKPPSATAEVPVAISKDAENQSLEEVTAKYNAAQREVERLSAELEQTAAKMASVSQDEPKVGGANNASMIDSAPLPPPVYAPSDEDDAYSPAANEGMKSAPAKSSGELSPTEQALRQQAEPRRHRVQPSETAPTASEVSKSANPVTPKKEAAKAKPKPAPAPEPQPEKVSAVASAEVKREVIAPDAPENAGGNYQEELERIRNRIEEQRKQMEALEAQLEAE